MIEKLVKIAKSVFSKTSERTDNYDKAASEVRNLLKATGATFIPKLCLALKEDWHHGRTEKEIQNNEDARQEMKDKITHDWSKEYHHEGIWKESSIDQWFPDWLMDPVMSEMGKKGAIATAAIKRAKKYSAKLQEQNITKKLENLAKVTPPAPKEEPEDTETGTEVTDHMLTPIGEKGTIPLLSMGEINQASFKLWEALTGKDKWAHSTDDLHNDFIKPTREYRAALFQELDPHEQNGIARRCEYLIALLEDTVQTIEKLSK